MRKASTLNKLLRSFIYDIDMFSLVVYPCRVYIFVRLYKLAGMQLSSNTVVCMLGHILFTTPGRVRTFNLPIYSKSFIAGPYSSVSYGYVNENLYAFSIRQAIL